MSLASRVSRSYLARVCALASMTLSACAGSGAEQSVVVPADEPVPSKTVAGPCADATTDDGFVNLAVASASRVLVADLVATPTGEIVYGLAADAADSDSDLIAALRFADGALEVRDGDTYRATQFAYSEGTSYDVRIIADLASGTYSVMTTRGDEAVMLAQHARLAAPVTELAMLAAIGSGKVCVESAAPEVVFARAGAHSVIADAGLISDGATTTRVGANGETLASLPRGGMLAVDAAENIYLARVDESTLTIESLTAAFAPRWSRTYAAPFGSHAQAVAITAQGDVQVLLAGNNTFTLRSVDAAGEPRLTRDLAVTAAIPNAAGFAVARTTDSSVTVEQFDRDAVSMWSRTWPNTADVQQMATSPTGEVLFAGGFTGTVNFGGGAIEAHPAGPNGALNAYVVALSPTGQHEFSQRFNERTVTAIAANGAQTIVAGHHSIGPLMTTRYMFDQTGAITDWREGLAGFGWFGKTYGLALASSGRVFWSYGPSWPDNFTEWPQLVAY